MAIIDIKQLGIWERLPGWRGRFFRGEAMSFSYYEFDAGASIPEHHHSNEEAWYVISGELELTLAGQPQRAPAGTAAIIPPDTRHSVRALAPGCALIASHPVRTDEPN